MYLFFGLTHFIELGQNYRNILVQVLAQIKTLKFASMNKYYDRIQKNKLLRKLYLSKMSHLNSFSTSNNGFKKGWWPSKLLALAEVWSRRTSYIFSCSNLSWSCWSMKVVRQFIKGCWQLVGWYKDQNIPFGNSFSNIFISTWNKKQCL